MELTQEEKLERQTKIVELLEQFNPARYNFIGKPGDEVHFTFTYNGDLPIQAVEPGCSGCTTLKCVDNKIEGVLTLDPKEAYVNLPDDVTSTPVNKSIRVWFEDGEDWYVISSEKQRSQNPRKITIPLYLSGQVDLR